MWGNAVLVSLLVTLVGQARALAEFEPPFHNRERQHWAFQSVEVPHLPFLEDKWPITGSVDSFVLARIEEAGIRPSAAADRRMLIRRATVDLHGIPPTAEDVQSFLADHRPDAYEHLIDRLLQSPRYGEHGARQWLDLVRYAESDGYNDDKDRTGAWRYRDYVIRSLNQDKPYDKFIIEQLAGDELPTPDGDAYVATGFLRHWPYEDNGRDLDQQLDLVLNDVTDVTGQVFLGLTVGCARCHDHKFDAILQKDYYRLKAFFASMIPVEDLPVGTRSELADYRNEMQTWRAETFELRRLMIHIERPFVLAERQEKGKQFPQFVRDILAKPETDRSVYDRQILVLAGTMLSADRKKMFQRMNPSARKQWEQIQKRLKALPPPKLPTARGVRDIGPEAAPTRIPGHAETDIAPGFLSVLDTGPAKIAQPSYNTRTTGRRLSLARWIASRDNPLTARVMVNRIWKQHFGRGLVETAGDFGRQGSGPSHPQLLDWLASEFTDRDWSIKHLHRIIMMSATYRQVSAYDPASAQHVVDPENKLFWRMALRRLSAEAIRDSMLSVSGERVDHMFGTSVRPELPAGLTGRYGWKATEGRDQQRRRSIYLVVKRNTHLPLLKTFDVPDNHKSCVRRDHTTTPNQALVLMNDVWPLQRALAFSKRVLTSCSTDLNETRLVKSAYQIAFGRPPTVAELQDASAFLKEPLPVGIDQRPAWKADEVFRDLLTAEGLSSAQARALLDLCHTLLNTNEFVYVD